MIIEMRTYKLKHGCRQQFLEILILANVYRARFSTISASLATMRKSRGSRITSAIARPSLANAGSSMISFTGLE
jgi:hypothetical protein